MIQLPPFDIADVEQVPEYDYTIQLGDDTFRVVLRYAERTDRWYLYLYDAADEPLLLGKRLSIDTPLLETYQIPGLPPGDIAIWDTSDSGVECGYEDLGRRCHLVYLEPADLADPTAAAAITIEVV